MNETSNAKRPERPCVACGHRTTAKSGTCRACTRPTEKAPTYAHALKGGQWVYVAGIARWVA